jgi:hypothetical protein
VFLAVCLASGLYYTFVKGEKRSAFNRWRPQVEALWAGEDIYQRYAFPTPPIMAMVLTPFMLLPGKAAMVSWFAFKAALTGLCFGWLFRAVRRAHLSLPQWIEVVALGVAITPIVGDLLHGNVNLWILFLVVAAWVAFQSGRDGLCGWALALAIACKVTPGLLLVYFMWKRAGRVVAHTVLGLAFWLVVLPGGILGFRAQPDAACPLESADGAAFPGQRAS